MTITLGTLVIILLLFNILQLIIARKQKSHKTLHRGAFMSIVIDTKLNVVEIVNPQPDIMLVANASSLVGCNIRNLETIVGERHRAEAKIIIENITKSEATKSDLFFEYTTSHTNGQDIQTICYVEHQHDGLLLCHVVKIDRAKRISGCSKCYDYVLSKALDSLSVGVYTHKVGRVNELAFENSVIHDLCECDSISMSPHWDPKQEDEANQKAIENGSTTYERVINSSDGQPTKWFRVSKQFMQLGHMGDYIITTVTDISEQREHEAELEETEIQLGMAIGASDVSVWRYNIDNKQFTSLYGNIDVPPVINLKEFKSMIHPDDVELCYETYKNIVQQKNKTNRIIFRILNPKTQTYQHIESNMTATISASGTVENIIGTYKDITTMHVKELELYEMRNSLDQAISIGDIIAWEADLVTQNFKILYGGEYENNTEFNKLTPREVVESYIHPEELDRYIHFVMDLIRNKEHDSIVVRGKDTETGKRRYYEMTISTIKNEDNITTKLLGTRRDISKVQLQQISLGETQKNLALALEAGEVSVWFYDIEKEKFFTIQGDTIAGEGLTMADNIAIMHPDDAVACVKNMSDLASGKVERINSIYRYKDPEIVGGYRYFEAHQIAFKEDGIVKNLTGTQKDVTKEHFHQKELEQSNLKVTKTLAELQQLYKYNKLILDNTNSGLIYITTDHVVRWENVSSLNVNSRYRTGYKTGNICYQSVKGTDEPCQNCVMHSAIRTKQKTQIELALENGEILDITAIPVINENGEIDGAILRIDDITDLKKSNLELQIAKEKAERSDLFKSTFLANMSHEIRTPLNAIVGFSELMADADSKEEKKEYSNIIAMNNELLLKLINDILDLSKIEAGYINITNTKFDLADLYNELYTTFNQRMHPGVRFICDNPYKSCMVELDRNRLTQVITNFVTNAIKFTSDGYIQIGYEWIDAGLRIYVSDTGIGISKIHLPTIFDRFEKLNNFAQGTGLGLSICKSIIESSNGTIGVDSEVGRGSTFWAIIPCKQIMDESQKHTTCSANATNTETNSNKTDKKEILIAEDTDSNYILISSILKGQYQFTRVINGKQAVDAVREHRYDAVLMDVKMPIMDGCEATRKIREFDLTTPIIALTANVFDSDRKQAIDAGCNDFLTKPINKTTLLDTLAKY